MKNSISKKTLIPLVILFVVLAPLFFIGSTHYLRHFMKDTYRTNLEAMAQEFHYHFQREAENGDIADEAGLKSFLKSYGDMIIENTTLDYVSSFIPDFEAVTLQFLEVSNDPSLDNEPGVIIAKNSDRPVYRYHISDEFKRVWNGEKAVSTIEYDNEYGYELCSFVKETTPYGQDFIITFEESINNIYKVTDKLFLYLAIAIILMFLLAFLAVSLSLKKNVTKPARAVSEAMDRFITDGSRSDTRLNENITGELGRINTAFNHMAENIDSYITDIRTLKSSEERQKAEFDIASHIQQGFLPAPSASFSGCELHAMMQPAREIGGDLYDYLQLDDERMLIMIADVSGKGISAAIFMVAAIMLMHEYAKMNLGPAEILEKANRSLSEKNPQLLFVTAFAGIYNNRTREFTYSNGGHNQPYLLKNGVEPLSGSTGTILGIFENEKYTQTTITLDPGDTLFLFTDGVNESTDRNSAFYGNKRLEELLGKYDPSSSRSLVDTVYEELCRFSEGAGQNDDITMLTLRAK